VAYIEDEREVGYFTRREGNKWTGGKVSEVGGFAFGYKEERRKVGGRSLPIYQGRSKIGSRPLAGAKK